jgi:hypothetical protein
VLDVWGNLWVGGVAAEEEEVKAVPFSPERPAGPKPIERSPAARAGGAFEGGGQVQVACGALVPEPLSLAP